MTRSFWFKVTVWVLFSFALGFSYNYHLPKFESFLLDRIERLSEKHSPVKVWADKLSFHLFPLGIVLENVRVLPQAPLDRYLAPASLKEVGARLAFLPLLRGEVRLSEVFIRDSEFNVFLKSELFAKSAGAARHPRFNLDEIYRLPVDELSLENIKIQGRLDPQNVVFQLSNVNLLIENRYHSLFIDAEAPKILVKPSGPASPMSAEVELRTLVEAHEMQISAFKLKADQSFVVASGRMNGDLIAGRLVNGAVNARVHANLPDLNTWERVFFLQPRLPAVSGQLDTDLGVELRGGKKLRVEANVDGRQMKVTRFTVGDVKGHISSDLKTISTNDLTFENGGGVVHLSKLQLALKPTPTVSCDLAVQHLHLKQFLRNLNVHHVPVKLWFDGKAQCNGTWADDPVLNCTAKISAPNLHVDSGKPKFKSIVDADNLRAGGTVKVTRHEVQYQADVQVGQHSLGRSSGAISYKKGFQIQYQAERLDMRDIKDLAGLKLEGDLKLAGKTSGTAHEATLDAQAQGNNLWLQDYPLGHVLAGAHYKAGHLRFDNVHGQVGVSRYDADLDLDLRNHTLNLKSKLPFVDLKDIETVFSRRMHLPISMEGTGTGEFEVKGPLRIQEMSYRLKSSFYRGRVAGESFDNAVINLHSDGGVVRSDDIHVTKANGIIHVSGQIQPDGAVNAVATGQSLRLEQSENLSALGFDVQGLADFNMQVRGHLPHPRIDLESKISHVVLGDHPVDDSAFKLSFLNDRVQGSGQFFGSTVVTDFIYPFDDNAPFLFKLETHEWDFTNLFAMISHSAHQMDFSTAVSMDVDLRAPKGGFWASNGRIHFERFVISKGGSQLKAENPMTLRVKDGTVNSENFALSSGENFLKLDVVNLNRNQLNASLNGKLDLSFLGLFAPFISDLRGNMAISVGLKGSLENPKLSGSSYIDKGYVKLAQFVHPFSHVRADVLFNDNQILINALRARLAGGKISASGKITLKSRHSRPVDIKGEFSDVNLNVPDGVLTHGSGTVSVSGEQFPYQLAVLYNVDGGKVTTDFQSKGAGTATVKASPYLPRFVSGSGFHPLTFDFDVNLQKPVTVANSLMQASVSGHVHAAGPPDRLILNGSFTPQPGGKVFVNEVPFDILSAYAEYNGAPPESPKLYLSASARVTDTVIDRQQHSTQHQYDVDMLLQGTPQKPDIQFTSQPPLNQNEIVSLLALGVTSANVETVSPSDKSAASTSSALGGAILQKAAGRRLKEALGVQVNVTSTQPTPDNAAAPKVTLSKQWTPKFGASASRTLESNPSNSVKLEYKMNRNVSVVGSWDGNEGSTLQNDTDTTKNVFGLDLEYKVNFK